MENLVPQLRFSEFESYWLEKLLGDIGEFKNGINKSGDDFGFGHPFVNLMDVFGKDFLLSENFGLVNATASELEKYNLIKGDVLFIRSSVKREGVGQTIVVLEDIIDTVFSGFLIRFRFILESFDDHFKRYCFHTPRFRSELVSKSTTSANTNINQDSLSTLSVRFPSLPEQIKIAEFLTAIDKRIELLTAKKEKLTLYKKGVMQKIFNQEIRFKQDDGGEFPEWEETTLGKIGSVVKLKNKENQISQVFTNSAKYGVVQQQDFFDREITTELNLKNYYIIDNGQFVYNPRISNLAPVGPIGMNKMGKGLLSPLYTVFSISIGHLAFFEQYFKSTLWHQYMRDHGNSGARSDRMSVTVGVLMNLPLYIPTTQEQIKIAGFLTTLDLEIQKLEEQITLNQTYKKGLLQQMFV